MKLNKNILFIFVVFTTIFISLEFIFPRYFSYDDNLYFIGAYKHSYQTLTEHRDIALINFNQYMGHVFLAQGQTGVLFFPVYIAAWISKLFTNELYWIADILAYFFLLSGCIAMFFLLKELGCKEKTPLAGAFLWISMPFVFTTSKSWIFISYMAFWLPFNFWALTKLSKTYDLKQWLLFSVIRTAMLFCGYIHYFHIMFVMEIVFISFSLLFKSGLHKKFILYFLSSYAVSSVLALPMLLPMYKAMTLSAERGAPLTFNTITEYSMACEWFFNSQIFDFSYWIFPTSSPIFFVGIPLLLIPLMVINKSIKDSSYAKHIYIFLSGGAVSLILSTKFYGYLSFIPTFSMFRWPFKYYLFFVFFLVIAVILIWNSVTEIQTVSGKLLMPVLITISLVSNVSLMFYSGNIPGYQMKLQPPIPFYSGLSGKETGRFFTGWVKNSVRTDAPKLMVGFMPNIFDLYHFAGYDPLVAKVNLKNSLNLNYISTFQSYASPELFHLLSKKGVKYLVTENKPETLEACKSFANLKIVYIDDEIIVFLNTTYLPIVYRSDSPQKEVKFVYGANKVDIFPENSGEINISLAPIEGYKVYFNGKPSDLKIEAVPLKEGIYDSYENIKINVPENVEKVTLKYEDPYFVTGVWISVITLFLSAVVLIIKKYRPI